MAKKSKPPSRKPGGPPLPDHHLAKMAGDADGLPDRRVTRAKEQAPEAPDLPDKPARMWEGRLKRANDVYDAWSKRFECARLDDYYEGRQWRGITEELAQQKYVINMVFATVESQLPSLLFTKPKVKVEARPSHEQTDGSQAGARATLIEQAIQTVFDDPKFRLGFKTTLSLRDAYSRFGIVEVGYSADWIDNPRAGKPVLKEDGSEMREPIEEGNDAAGTRPVREPTRVLKPGTKESPYLKHIPAWRVRVSPGKNDLKENNWIAYYEWVELHDVKRNPAYKHTENLKASGILARTLDDEERDDEETQSRAGMVKLWKIYDLRLKVRHVLAEGHAKLLQMNKPFSELPFADLKFFERKDAYYPQPPIYNWLSPQDEINETREMERVHRRRAVRRYIADPRVDAPELEKLETNEDMTVIRVQNPEGAIVPIADAPLHPQVTTEALLTAQSDLDKIAGVTGEIRSNTRPSSTATAANISNARTEIRESRARAQVAAWLAEIARLVLLVMRERMKLPWMVKRHVDPFAFMQDPQQVQHATQRWMEIESEDISDLDVDITIDVASLSPVAQEAERNNWNVVLSLLTNPALATILMTPNPGAPDEPSPLLRKTLMLNGITSDVEIREIWRVGQAVLNQASEAAKAQAAIAKTPDPMKLSLALKTEDLLLFGPEVMAQVAQYIVAALSPDHALTAAATARAESPLTTGGGGGLTIPSGKATGMPATTPGVM